MGQSLRVHELHTGLALRLGRSSSRLSRRLRARAYGLTCYQLRNILDPADVKGPEHPSGTFRVLKEEEIRQHGENRTRLLLIAAWDRTEVNGEFWAMGDVRWPMSRWR